jgi:hypothetical protein
MYTVRSQAEGSFSATTRTASPAADRAVAGPSTLPSGALPLRTTRSSQTAPRTGLPARRWPKVEAELLPTREVVGRCWTDADRGVLRLLVQARHDEIDVMYMPRDERKPPYDLRDEAAATGDRHAPFAASETSSEAASCIAPERALGLRHVFDEVPFLGYVRGVEEDERRLVRGEELQDLRDANDTGLVTHAILHYGRGNVKQDNEATGRESEARCDFSRGIATDRAQRRGAVLPSVPEFVGAAIRAAAGNCGEHAHVAGIEHARKLTPGQELTVAERIGTDHTWVQLKTARGDRINIDTWCDGPSVKSKHARYGRSTLGLRQKWHLDHLTGPSQTHLATATADSIDADTTYSAWLSYYREACQSLPECHEESEPVIRGSFSRRVTEKMSVPIPLRTALTRSTPATAGERLRQTLATAKEVARGSSPSDAARSAAEDRFAILQVGVRQRIKTLALLRTLDIGDGVKESAAVAGAVVDAAMDLRKPRRAEQIKETLAVLQAREDATPSSDSSGSFEDLLAEYTARTPE